MLKILETNRLILRVFEERDIDAMTLINQDPAVCEFLAGIGNYEKTVATIHRIIKQHHDHGFSLYAVELKSTGEMIGWCGLFVHSFQAHFMPAVEIGWRLASHQWGYGYATEAAKAVLAYAFETLKLKEVVSFTVVDNIRSRRVMKKIGLQHNPADDFDHPDLEKTHPLRRHVLYRISNIGWWGREYLLSHHYVLIENSIETVQHTPWSTVIRFKTSADNIYLKSMPPALACESAITKMLHDQFHAPVPKIIVINDELNCFLMKDAGIPLRTILKRQFDSELFCKAINAYTVMQLKTVNAIDQFFKIGVPDWRLENFPALYDHLLSEREILSLDGLSEKEIEDFKKLSPKVKALCQQLSAFSIPSTIVQCDFHDNNILIDEKTNAVTLIDLGEIVVSHPFFSLVTCLFQVTRHHGLTEKDVAYQDLVTACLKHYAVYISREELTTAFSCAQKLWCVYEACCQYRLRILCNVTKFLSFQQQGKLADRLREFLSA